MTDGRAESNYSSTKLLLGLLLLWSCKDQMVDLRDAGAQPSESTEVAQTDVAEYPVVASQGREIEISSTQRMSIPGGVATKDFSVRITIQAASDDLDKSEQATIVLGESSQEVVDISFYQNGSPMKTPLLDPYLIEHDVETASPASEFALLIISSPGTDGEQRTIVRPDNVIDSALGLTSDAVRRITLQHYTQLTHLLVRLVKIRTDSATASPSPVPTSSLSPSPTTSVTFAMADIADVGGNEDTAIGPVAIQLTGTESQLTNTTIDASSSNTNLIPDSGIAISGSGGSRTMTITPAANASGNATITLTVSSGAETPIVKIFDVVVDAINDSPTITDIANQTVNEDGAGFMAFTVGDVETAVGSLNVSAQSDDQVLIANGSIILAGSGASRTVTIVPASNANGNTTVTITVTDALGATSSDTILVTVSAVNDAPIANAGSDQSAGVNDLVTLSAVGSSDTEGSTLTYSWSQPQGTAVTLSSTTAQSPTFTAPAGASTLVFALVVSDGGQTSVADTVSITVTDFCSGQSGVTSPTAIGGSGTVGDPYLICTKAQLQNIVTNISTHKWNSFKLMADIDIGGANWAPIGSDTSPYLATFDGNNKTISNLTYSGSANYVGLFGGAISVVKNIKIRNPSIVSSGLVIGALVAAGGVGLIIDNCEVAMDSLDGNSDIQGARYVGGLVGTANVNSIIRNSSVHAHVKATQVGDSNVGGLIGMATGVLEVNDNTTSGKVEGSAFVGGMIGYFVESNSTNSTGLNFDSNTSSSTIVDTDEPTGGMIGNFRAATSGTYKISNSSFTGSISSAGNAGGLVGEAIFLFSIEKASNTGSVSGGAQVGGLVGRVNGSAGYSISDSYNRGNVTGTGDYVGGAFGYVENYHGGSITRCYSTGTVTASGATNRGGLIGAAAHMASVANSYYISTAGFAGSGTSKTAAELKQQSTFTTYDFTNVWSIVDGVSYPTLSPAP